MALALLPCIAIRPAFHELEEESVVAEYNLITLFEYFQQAWLQIYLPRLWCVFNTRTRANNKAEGWHSKFRKNMRMTHPASTTLYVP